MSKPYPSRRELRLQRDRQERAKLRDEESQRWADEVEQRQGNVTATDSAIGELIAEVEGAAIDNAETTDEEAEDTAGGPGRRASNRNIDTPTGVEEPAAESAAGSRRRRRADSEVTSTGMIPLITKPRDELQPEKPRSRREIRELESQRAAQRRAEVARLERVQTQLEEESRPVRRATAPQATPPPVPAPQDSSDVPVQPTAVEPAFVTPDNDQPETIDVTLSESHEESAAEITDMSGLDTIEIRRAELRIETEKLTQEIMQLGQENPNVIDPVMLRRQKELADKSHELQKLETAAIAIVEENGQQDTESTDAGTAPTDASASYQTPAASIDAPDAQTNTTVTPRRRARRSQTGPMITGPFTVTEEPDTTEERTPATTGSGEPVDASDAHGLDSLDAREVEAPERRLMMTAAIIFAIGIIAFIAALILLIL